MVVMARSKSSRIDIWP